MVDASKCCARFWGVCFVTALLHAREDRISAFAPTVSSQSNLIYYPPMLVARPWLTATPRVGGLQASLADSAETTETENFVTEGKENKSLPPKVLRPVISSPTSYDEMIRQVASAMRTALLDYGIQKQIVRVLLPRNVNAQALGQIMELSPIQNDDRFGTDSASQLVPPDESWQGGIMQLYRSAAPTALGIMQEFSNKVSISSSTSTTGNVPPRFIEDRTVDPSGTDGVGLLYSTPSTAMISSFECWIQPTQEIVPDICQRSPSAPTRAAVSVLMNPQWRLVDDALDVASSESSSSPSWLSNFASFLGGKGNTLKLLKEDGYQPVYTLEQYVCRNCNIRLIQVIDSKWHIYYEPKRQEGSNHEFVYLGSTDVRPTYQEVKSLVDAALHG
jgi:Domain of unknown function (DUF1995)